MDDSVRRPAHGFPHLAKNLTEHAEARCCYLGVMLPLANSLLCN